MPVQREAKTLNPFVAQVGKWSRLFILSAGVLLFVTGAAKMASAFGKSSVLAKPDPVFGIRFSHLLSSLGFVEIIIALICLTYPHRLFNLWLVAALSINFLGYRTELWLIHWRGYCPCLGTLTQAIHLSRHQADLLTRTILAYLVLGSTSCLAYSWLARKKGHDRLQIGSASKAFSDSSSYRG